MRKHEMFGGVCECVVCVNEEASMHCERCWMRAAGRYLREETSKRQEGLCVRGCDNKGNVMWEGGRDACVCHQMSVLNE